FLDPSSYSTVNLADSRGVQRVVFREGKGDGEAQTGTGGRRGDRPGGAVVSGKQQGRDGAARAPHGRRAGGLCLVGAQREPDGRCTARRGGGGGEGAGMRRAGP